jgi:predicted nuclease of restriction endonuclease-like (RecB) superfamily
MKVELEIKTDNLFDKVVAILEQARTNVVRSVNSNMVAAYWLIGREIVEEVQSGEKRAEYGKQVIENLSKLLNRKYGKGFSITNLWYFRQFYLTYNDRLLIPHPLGGESHIEAKFSPTGRESNTTTKRYPSGGESQKPHPTGAEFENSFNPNLSWSHYRALMRVKKPEARDFYEQEAAECGWSKSQLERQIHTSYYERILSNKGKEGLLPTKHERLAGDALPPIHALKSPVILEFLDLPDSPVLHEKDLEQAIINNLQEFLLELGKGFSFVARQKHIRFDDDDFYLDLVFYNYILKCFLLIDLKIGKLTHRDIGQMDGYVRLFEDRFKVDGDNPTIGLILCSDKSETVARYSVLSENKQLFAAKYLDFLPTEEELQAEIKKERILLEEAKDE